MNNANQVKIMETRTKNNDVVFFKSQEEFVKALREGAVEETGLTEELVEEE